MCFCSQDRQASRNDPKALPGCWVAGSYRQCDQILEKEWPNFSVTKSSSFGKFSQGTYWLLGIFNSIFFHSSRGTLMTILHPRPLGGNAQPWWHISHKDLFRIKKERNREIDKMKRHRYWKKDTKHQSIRWFLDVNWIFYFYTSKLDCGSFLMTNRGE